MVNQIGEVAGNIWQTLKEDGETSVAQLKKKVEGNAFLLDSAVGWLAREDKVVVSKKGNSYVVNLK